MAQSRLFTSATTKIKLIKDDIVYSSDEDGYRFQSINYTSNAVSDQVEAIGELDPVAYLPRSRENRFDLTVVATDKWQPVLNGNTAGQKAKQLQVMTKDTGNMVYTLVDLTIESVGQGIAANSGEVTTTVSGRYRTMKT